MGAYISSQLFTTGNCNKKLILVVVNYFEREFKLEKGTVPHGVGARCMTPHKSEACRAETEKLLDTT